MGGNEENLTIFTSITIRFATNENSKPTKKQTSKLDKYIGQQKLCTYFVL